MGIVYLVSRNRIVAAMNDREKKSKSVILEEIAHYDWIRYEFRSEYHGEKNHVQLGP